jgi:hypothetical protein
MASSTDTPSLIRATSPGDYEFLIFGYLLRFIHREGKTGDLARAGLLFLIDVAMTAAPASVASSSASSMGDASLALAEYLLDSDFAEVLGAGLGALYGLLPSKLVVRAPGQEDGHGGMVLGGMGDASDAPSESELDRMDALGIGDSSLREFADALALLLKLVAFTQDVLRRAPSTATARPLLQRSMSSTSSSAVSSIALVSAAMADSILHAVRSIFLEAILYPSLLECAEHDGSAVAVLTYLEALLSTIEGGTPLGATVLDFLLASGPSPATLARASMATLRPRAGEETTPKVSKRKSTALLLVEGVSAKRTAETVFTSEGRYTLRDLLLQHLACDSQPTKLAALRLLTTLLLCHRGHADALLDLGRAALPDEDGEDEVFVYPGATLMAQENEAGGVLLRHAAEMADLLGILALVDPSSEPASTSALGRYTRDAELMLARSLAPTAARQLSWSSSLLRTLLDTLLAGFFGNTPDVNLALTGVLSALATEPSYSIADWLLPYSTPFAAVEAMQRPELERATSDDGDDRSIDHIYEDRHRLGLLPSTASLRPRWSDRSTSAVFGHLERLARQVAAARVHVADFDVLLAERRSGLLFVDSLADALSDAPPSSSHRTPDSPRPSRANGAVTGTGTGNPFAAHYARTAALASPFDAGTGSLSVGLDNVVVLEEAVKELVAVVQCRRALGIDPL